jgi:hypothetical protein
MIIRNINGELVIIKRDNYVSDNEYIQEIMKIISLYKEKYDSFYNVNAK